MIANSPLPPNTCGAYVRTGCVDLIVCEDCCCCAKHCRCDAEALAKEVRRDG